MPSYKAPGVYVGEHSAMPPPITALPTDIALFVGVVVTTPAGGDPGPLSSLADFETLYGLPDPAVPATGLFHLAVRAFFANGGRRLRIAPVLSNDAAAIAAALAGSAGLTDVAIVAAPGAASSADPLAAAQALIAHVEADGSRRFAIIDPPAGLDVAGIQSWRAPLVSANAALYFPWVVAPDETGAPLAQPPSAFVAGIYARVDSARGVFKSPANEIVIGATKLALNLTVAQQQILNPLGIDCIVTLQGKGICIWGARTLSADGNARYVSVRRFQRWLAASIAAGLQWAVFEPNGERLWATVQGVVSTFLMMQWRAGALTGTKPEQAFYVRCDRATMTQSDLDGGFLVCEIGIAPLRPAEFLIFRVRIKTAG